MHFLSENTLCKMLNKKWVLHNYYKPTFKKTDKVSNMENKKKSIKWEMS